MRRDAGSWLDGPIFQRDEPRGSRLGLPAQGRGSLASPGARLAAVIVDAVVANLLAGLPYLFGVHCGPGVGGCAVYAAVLLQEFLLDSVAGATIGKQLCGIRVVRLDGGRLTWPWALARTVLLGFLIPAVIWDRDGRGLHDRAAGAITIRTGGPAEPANEASPAPSQAASPRAHTAAATAPAAAASRPGTGAPRKAATKRQGGSAAKRRKKRR